MKLRVKDVLESIDEQELYKMQQDLSKGGVFLKKLINEKIRQKEATKAGYCITCGDDLGNRETSYTLIFGPEDMRKKATFCEIDCLEYFLSGLKKMKRGGNNAI